MTPVLLFPAKQVQRSMATLARKALECVMQQLQVASAERQSQHSPHAFEELLLSAALDLLATLSHVASD